MNQDRYLIISPTYNEKGNIDPLIDTIMELEGPFDVLVVDDGSPDGTAEVVRERQEVYGKDRIHLLCREGKNGLGSAYRAGYRYAMENNYGWLIQMDADFSHHPKYLADFVTASKTSDVVLGSRYKEGKISVVNWDWKRLLLSYMANIYARIVTGLPVRDSTGGFKCFKLEAIRSLDLDKIHSDGYSFQIETSFRLWKKGYSIEEIPIVFTDREVGVSKLSGGIIYEALFVLLKLRFGR